MADSRTEEDTFKQLVQLIADDCDIVLGVRPTPHGYKHLAAKVRRQHLVCQRNYAYRNAIPQL